MSCRRGASGSLVSGLLILSIGLILLAGQMGLVDVRTIFRYWPVIFCIIGVSKLFGAQQTAQRLWGGFLIIFGGILLTHQMGYIPYGIGQLWPLVIIAAGLLLIWQHYEARQGGQASAGNDVQTVSIFGGSERRLTARDFKGGQTFALFGGFELDLTQAEIDGPQAVLESTVVFGGGEIRVPRHWTVVITGMGIFGAYSDETHQEIQSGTPTKTLVVKGVAVFGGVEIKN